MSLGFSKNQDQWETKGSHVSFILFLGGGQAEYVQCSSSKTRINGKPKGVSFFLVSKPQAKWGLIFFTCYFSEARLFEHGLVNGWFGFGIP